MRNGRACDSGEAIPEERTGHRLRLTRAARKAFHGNRWIFSDGNTTTNPASHCDIAWAGGLATEASNLNVRSVGAAVA